MLTTITTIATTTNLHALPSRRIVRRAVGLFLVLFSIALVLHSSTFPAVVEGARGGGGGSSKKKNEVLTDLPCTKQAEADVDVVFGRMSGYGNGSRSFPINENELGSYCKGQLDDIKMLDSYAKRCKKGLPKQYFSIMLYTVKGNMQRICKKSSKKAKQLLAASACIRRASPHFDTCHRNLIHRLHKVKYADNKKKIPYTCCEYYTLQKCFQEGGRVKAKCTAKDMETVEELMESTSSNALQFFCGEYAEDSDKCEKLGPISTPASGKQAKPKFLRSISLTVAEIFESFPEQKNI